MIEIVTILKELGLDDRVSPSKVIMGKVCRRGHCGLRYKNGGACVECVRSDANRARVKAYNAEAYKKNPAKWKTYADTFLKTPAGRACTLLTGARARAKKSGIEISLTHEWVQARIARGVCEISGLPFYLGPKPHNTRSPYSPSIDRIDASKGYTPENSRVILWSLNASFGDWGSEEFKVIAREWLKRDLNSSSPA